MKTIELNIMKTTNKVNCGDCGYEFKHKIGNIEVLTCPECGFTSEICDFPDVEKKNKEE